jgi:Replication initiation factor
MMIDKIEVMVKADTRFRGELQEFHSISPFDPCVSHIRPSKFYHLVADLRPRGFDALLHVGLKLGGKKSHGDHKIELLETGKKGMREIDGTLEAIADCDPRGCRVGRIDLAADIPDVSLSWFREHAYVQYKQFVSAHAKMQECEYTEMGKKVYQTLYFGKRPSCVRIYDKIAERTAHYVLWKRREIRAAKKEGLEPPEFPTLEEWLSVELPRTREHFQRAQQIDLLPDTSPTEQRTLSFPVVTRVENQFGGRVPEQMKTVAEMRKNVRDFNPFSRMKIISGRLVPPGLFDRDLDGRYRFSVPQWCFYMYVREHWNTEGASQMRQMLNRDRNGKLYLKNMCEFLPVSENQDEGIAELELFERYRDSVSQQLAA